MPRILGVLRNARQYRCGPEPTHARRLELLGRPHQAVGHRLKSDELATQYVQVAP